MNFLTYLIAAFFAYLLMIGVCVVYAGVTRKTYKQARRQEQNETFEERIQRYKDTEQAKQDDPIARIHSIEWDTESREVIDLKFEECV